MMSFRAYYGVTGPHPAEPPGRPHSSWSMGPKHAFPRKSTWVLHESKLLMNPYRKNYGTVTWTSLMNDGGEQQSKMHVTTRCSGAIINGLCIVGSSGPRTLS